jgi:two-component system, response regulator / RNA-binding antiterminator
MKGAADVANDVANLAGAVAVILHRPHATVDAIARQLTAIGLKAAQCWPELSHDCVTADFIFFDTDRGYDQQLPWQPGEAPMPMVALIESEAPGRIDWALSQGSNAALMKPVGNKGVYASLLISRRHFLQRQRQAAEAASLRERLAARRTVVQAAFAIRARDQVAHGDAAYLQLRSIAMTWRISMEEAAQRIVAASIDADDDRQTAVAKSRNIAAD